MKCILSLALACFCYSSLNIAIAASTDELFSKGRSYWRQGQYNQSIVLLRKAAEQGHPVAQHLLGFAYERGLGVPKSPTDSYNWYLKSAKQGHIQSQNNLGGAYQIGFGVKKDISTAIKWYKRAADQGLDQAQNNLGATLFSVKKYKEGVKWYMRAARQGYTLSQRNLAWAYNNGKGVPENYHEAVKWYKKALFLGDKAANKNLSELYKQKHRARNSKKLPEPDLVALEPLLKKGTRYWNDGNHSEAYKWFKNAAEQGHPQAQLRLGELYLYGEGVERHLHRAIEWFKNAAQQGNSDALNLLGQQYYDGIGVSKNDKLSFLYFKKAAEMGHANAQGSLGAFYFSGIGVEKNQIKGIKWFKLGAQKGDKYSIHALDSIKKEISEYNVTLDDLENLTDRNKPLNAAIHEAANPSPKNSCTRFVTNSSRSHFYDVSIPAGKSLCFFARSHIFNFSVATVKNLSKGRDVFIDIYEAASSKPVGEGSLVVFGKLLDNDYRIEIVNSDKNSSVNARLYIHSVGSDSLLKGAMDGAVQAFALSKIEGLLSLGSGNTNIDSDYLGLSNNSSRLLSLLGDRLQGSDLGSSAANFISNEASIILELLGMGSTPSIVITSAISSVADDIYKHY